MRRFRNPEDVRSSFENTMREHTNVYHDLSVLFCDYSAGRGKIPVPSGLFPRVSIIIVLVDSLVSRASREKNPHLPGFDKNLNWDFNYTDVFLRISNYMGAHNVRNQTI